MKGKRNLVVIGGGPGGLVVASVAAQLGLKVTLAEKSDRLGGDCLHHGCIPSKTLIRSARVAHLMRNGARYGLPACEPEIDLNPIVDRVESVIADIQRHDDPERFRAYGCDVRFAPARFIGPHEVRIGDEVVTAKRCVIATGSQPAVPPIPGLQEAGYDTNETIFGCRQLPPRLAVIGAGPIGVELAQAYARLGSQVTVIEQSARVLPAVDADIADCLAGVLRDEGIKVHTAAAVTHVRRDGDSRQLFLADGATVECERILVATGRQAAVFGLGLEAAGVDCTPRALPLTGDCVPVSNTSMLWVMCAARTSSRIWLNTRQGWCSPTCCSGFRARSTTGWCPG
ncbi:MAG: FAD-dependent oxidoreductase [Gammaproteobacteria bacterium]|nr:FAD-dependent oxidoreductase [Gammaproteobacteria bacterium]